MRCEGHQTLSCRISEVLVTDLREAIADMLVDAGQVPDEALHRHPIRCRRGRLVLGDARHAGAAPDPRHDRDIACLIGGGQRGAQLGIGVAGRNRKIKLVCRGQ